MLERHASTRRPAIQEGDLAICYAAVWQALFALVEISSPPEHDPARERWAWSFAVRPLVALHDLHDAPAAEEAGIFPSSLWRHSYIRLADEQFARACSLLERALVRTGYDTVAGAYERWAAAFHAPVLQTLERLTGHLPPGARVLDLGCGNGVPVARALVGQGYEVTGVDSSVEQLTRARRNVPAAAFVRADVVDVELSPESFDAVVSTFVTGHVPRREHAQLLRRIHGWLRPGGRVLATFPLTDEERFVDEDWLGAPMLFSGFAPARTRELLTDAGLELEWEQEVPMDEPGHGRVSFLWTLSRRLPGIVAVTPSTTGPRKRLQR